MLKLTNVKIACIYNKPVAYTHVKLISYVNKLFYSVVFEQEEFINKFLLKYVIKTVKGSIRDLKKFQDGE